MNEAIYNLLNRRSVRVYKEEQIRDDELRVLLECGLYAPCGGGLQNVRFLVVQDPKIMAELNRIIQKELASRALVGEMPINRGILRARKDPYQFIYGAPTLIVAVSPKDWDNAMADCSCAIENIWLAASAIGLGACWSNQPHWLTDVPAIREIFSRIGLREDENICTGVSVGYVGYVAKIAAPRKENRVSLDRPRELSDGLLKDLLM